MKCAGQWQVGTKFDVPSIASQVSQDHGAGCNIAGVSKINQVRELFKDLKRSLWLHRFHMPVDNMLARLAVAFLICPERLVCANREKQQQAAFSRAWESCGGVVQANV